MENCSNHRSMCFYFNISAGFLKIALFIRTFSRAAFHMLVETLSGHLVGSVHCSDAQSRLKPRNGGPAALLKILEVRRRLYAMACYVDF